MRILIVCLMLSCACALPPPPSARAAERSDSEESEREAIQIAFDKLRDLTRAGGYEDLFEIPERYRETVLAFLDRLNDVALESVGDRDLSGPARDKKQFLAVLDLLEEMTSAGGSDGDGEAARNRETFLDIIHQTKQIVRRADADAPPDLEAYRPVLVQLAELARARGAQDQDIQLFVTFFNSITADVRFEAERGLRR